MLRRCIILAKEHLLSSHQKLLCLMLFLTLLVLSFASCNMKDERREIQGEYECVELHSNGGSYISYAIKPAFDTDSVWSYVVPRWFPKYFKNKFMWCANSYDFVIYSSDTGLHLYLFDSAGKTWKGDFYLKYVDGQLYYCDQRGIVGEYSQNALPTEAVEYLSSVQ